METSEELKSQSSAKSSKKQSKFNKLQEQVDEAVREKWKQEQAELKKKLVEEDLFDWYLPDLKNPEYNKQQEAEGKTKLEFIGAVDISYSKTDSQKAWAALVVLSYPSFDVLYEDYEIDTTDYPYIPGFLAFKEVPSLSILFDRLKEKSPKFWPQVLLVDGNGILHNRGFGAASHIGVVMDVPSIGVGKTVFAVDGITQKGVKDMSDEKLLKGGDLEYLTGKSGKVWGAALRSTDDSKNPIIISVGTRVSLETAISVVRAWIVGFRIPEPIRQADKRSRVWVQKAYDGYDKHHKKTKGTKDYTKDLDEEKKVTKEVKKKLNQKQKPATDDDGWTNVA